MASLETPDPARDPLAEPKFIFLFYDVHTPVNKAHKRVEKKVVNKDVSFQAGGQAEERK